jgi:hypothetical protein
VPYSPVIGGPQLDSPLSLTFQLHEFRLEYQIPSGAMGVATHGHQVINYRQNPEEFKSDFESGSSYLCLHRASWNYFKNGLLKSFFPPEEIGHLRYKIGLVKFPREYASENSMEQLKEYVAEFIEAIMNAPEGLNSNIRKAFPDDTEENLAKDLAHVIKQMEIKIANSEWLMLELATGILDRKIKFYYFTPLTEGYAVLLQFEPYNNKNYEKITSVIDDTNEKAMEIILNSTQLLK